MIIKNLILLVGISFAGVLFLPAQLSVEITDSSNLSCYESMDGSATASILGASGPVEIQWSDDSHATNATALNLQANRWYRVTATDTANNTAKDSVRLSQPEDLVYQLDGLKTVQCNGLAKGYLKLSASGGVGPYEYSWTGEITSDKDSVFNLSAGQYYFGVMDSLLCYVTYSLTLEEAELVEVSIDSLVPNPCLMIIIQQFYISVRNGTEPYTYNWTGWIYKHGTEHWWTGKRQLLG